MASESLADLDEVVHEPSREFVESTNVWEFMQGYDIDDYEELIERTTTDIDGVPESGVDWFWDELVDYLGIEFYEDYDTVRDDSGAQRAPDDASSAEQSSADRSSGQSPREDDETASRDGPQFTDWYPGGELNIAHNVVDRHAAADEERRNKVACIWEGEDGEIREVTFHELHRRANQVANALEARGIGTGDTVGLYMPMVPEVIAILYGCFKIGAIAVPIFSGFGVDATATRIEDPECSVLFTGDGFLRRGDAVTLKGTADEAVEQAETDVASVIVYDRLGASNSDADPSVPMTDGRDEWWSEAVATQSDDYDTKSLPSDQESMLLYSSGTTGKPKGIVHTHAGV